MSSNIAGTGRPETLSERRKRERELAEYERRQAERDEQAAWVASLAATRQQHRETRNAAAFSLIAWSVCTVIAAHHFDRGMVWAAALVVAVVGFAASLSTWTVSRTYLAITDDAGDGDA